MQPDQNQASHSSKQDNRKREGDRRNLGKHSVPNHLGDNTLAVTTSPGTEKLSKIELVVPDIGSLSLDFPEVSKTEVFNIPTFDPLCHYDRLKANPVLRDSFEDILLCGIDPYRPNNGFFDPFNETFWNESFPNVGEHVVAVTIVAEILGLELLNLGLIKKEEFNEALQRALLHDATKPADLIVGKARKSGLLPKDHSKHEAAHIETVLIANGIDPRNAKRLAAYGSESGHHSLIKFLSVSPQDQLQLSVDNLVAIIGHLADNFVSTSLLETGKNTETRIVTIQERMIASDFKTRYPFLWEQGLGYRSDNGNTIEAILDMQNPPKETIPIANFASLQAAVTEGFCEWIKHKKEPNSCLTGGRFIIDMLNKRLSLLQ